MDAGWWRCNCGVPGTACPRPTWGGGGASISWRVLARMSWRWCHVLWSLRPAHATPCLQCMVCDAIWQGLQKVGCWTTMRTCISRSVDCVPHPVSCSLRGEVIPTLSCVDLVSQTFPLFFSNIYNGYGGASSILLRVSSLMARPD